MDAIAGTPELRESDRRKPGARGRLAVLADGQPWLIAEPVFQPTRHGLISPDVDAEVNRFYEQIVLGDDLSLIDVLSVARILVLANYDLSDDEVAALVEVEGGPEAERLAGVVLEALFGPDHKDRGYTDWVRASLLANGLELARIPASAIDDVLAILISTHRTVPPSRFIDACRVARERDSLERLI